MQNNPSTSPEELVERLTLNFPMSAKEAVQQLSDIGISEEDIRSQMPKMAESDEHVLLSGRRSGQHPTVTVRPAGIEGNEAFPYFYDVRLDTFGIEDSTDFMNSVRGPSAS